MVAPLCPLDLPQFYNKIARMCESIWRWLPLCVPWTFLNSITKLLACVKLPGPCMPLDLSQFSCKIAGTFMEMDDPDGRSLPLDPMNFRSKLMETSWRWLTP